MTDALRAPIMSAMQIMVVKRLMALEAMTLAVVSPIHLARAQTAPASPRD